MRNLQTIFYRVFLIGFVLGLVIPSVRAVVQQDMQALEKKREEAFKEGRRLFFQGEFEAAKQRFHEAFMISKLMPPRNLDIISLNYEGLCYQYQDELDLALDTFNQALRLRDSLVATRAGDPEYIADSLNNIGWAFYLKGDYDQALTYLKRAEDIGPDERVGHDGPKLSIWNRGRILTNMGVVRMALGDYSNAFKYLRYVVGESDTHNDKMGKTRSFQYLANLERSWGNYAVALRSLEKAVRIGQQAGDQVYNRAYLVDAMNDLGILYGQLQKSAKARATFQEALAISRQLGTRRLMARTLVNLGNLARDQGQLQIAVGHHQQALTISREITLCPLMGMALAELGWDSLQMKNPQQAIQFFQQALDAGGETLPPEVRTRVYSGLAEAFETLNDLRKAAEYYRLTIESIEKVRIETLTEDRKIGYWQSKQATFERAVTLLHRLRQQDSGADYTAQAFAYAERARARALLDLLAEAKVKPSRGLGPEIQQEEGAIFQNISRIQKKLLRDDVSQAERSKLERELTRAEERLEEFKQRVRLSHPAYAALQYPQPLTLDQVQREVLTPDTLLLEFMLGEKQSFLWAVSKTESQMVVLPGRQEIEQQVTRYRQTITTPSSPADTFSVYSRRGRRLYQLLVGPVEKMLGGTKHVIVVPDGILHYLPFETLVTRPVAGRPRFLISDYSISYASSASALGLLQTEHSESNLKDSRLLAYADPVFKPHDKRTKDKNQLVDVTRSLYRERETKFDQLPDTRKEVTNIAALYPKTAARLYLGREATESSLKRERLERFHQIHFATHGVIDEDVPARSGVVLSLVGEEQEDGVLQMNEIFNLDLNADLVVLSACQSGVGKVVRGEGMIGMTRAFMYAGADSIVVSLWNVRDSSTAEFMKGFYRYLSGEKPKAEALRQTKLDMLRSNRPAYRHPYFWAPFVLAGKSR